MLSILLAEKIATLFIIIAMGAFALRRSYLQQSDAKPISKLAMYIVTPFTTIYIFQVDYTPEVVDGLLLGIAVSLVFCVMMLAGTELFSRFICKLSPLEKTSIIYSNSMNLIIPLVIMLMGKEYLVYGIPYMVIQMILMWSHGYVEMSGMSEINWKKIFLNINIVASVAGALIFISGLRFWGPVNIALESMAMMTGPLAMLITGMSVGGMTTAKIRKYRRVAMVTVLRLIVMPFLSCAVLKYSGITDMVPNGEMILLVTLLAAATPSASTLVQFAEVYDRNAEYASVINVVTTMLCIFTMPLIVAYYQM